MGRQASLPPWFKYLSFNICVTVGHLVRVPSRTLDTRDSEVSAALASRLNCPDNSNAISENELMFNLELKV